MNVPEPRAAVVSAATTAAIEVAADVGIGLRAEPALLDGVANTVLGFADDGIVAKVATRRRVIERAPMEHRIAVELAAMRAPSARPVAGVGPTVHPATGFVVTFWHYVHADSSTPPPRALADSLARLHDALDATGTELPPFVAELQSARGSLANDDFMAELARADRAFLTDTYDAELARLDAHDYQVHRLHGEPHEANRVVTPTGVVWVDFESCCTGPREWDLAFLADEAIVHLPHVDRDLLACLRRLNHARLATWRWGLVRDYPELRDLARADLTFLRSTS